MNWKTEIKKGTTETKIVNNFIMLINNINGYELVEILFGQPYNEMENHKKEYVQKFMGASANRLWGMLDNSKRELLVEAAMDKYGR